MRQARVHLPAVLALLVVLSSPAFAAGEETRYTFLFAGNQAGTAVTRILPDGERVFQFEFNDRGRGPQTETRVRLGPGGIPVAERITGHDYWKTPVDERYERQGDKASWKNMAENGRRASWPTSSWWMAIPPPASATSGAWCLPSRTGWCPIPRRSTVHSTVLAIQ